jgi:hypothetical protein
MKQKMGTGDLGKAGRRRAVTEAIVLTVVVTAALVISSW